MAEQKMREAVTEQIQGEISMDEAELQARQQEFSELQDVDDRAAKRQKWMQSISGQTTTAPSQQFDPSSIGARPGLLGGAGGRPLRGALATEDQPRIGLDTMRSPATSSKPLAGVVPLPVRTVKTPIAPVSQPILESEQSPVEEMKIPVGGYEVSITPGEDGVFGTDDDEAVLQPRTDLEEAMEDESLENLHENIVEVDVETELTEVDEESVEIAELRPVVGVLRPMMNEVEEVQTASLRPLPPTLNPVQSEEKTETPTAKLTPVKGVLQPAKLRPVKKLQPIEDDSEENQQSE
jgi:hypothetical protein